MASPDWLTRASEAATTLGFIVGAGALLVAARQATMTARFARGTMWFDLRRFFLDYDDVHIPLRLRVWPERGRAPDVSDLPRVESYLGLLEHCEVMFENGV